MAKVLQELLLDASGQGPVFLDPWISGLLKPAQRRYGDLEVRTHGPECLVPDAGAVDGEFMLWKPCKDRSQSSQGALQLRFAARAGMVAVGCRFVASVPDEASVQETCCGTLEHVSRRC